MNGASRGDVQRPTPVQAPAKRPIPPTVFRFEKASKIGTSLDTTPKELPIRRPVPLPGPRFVKDVNPSPPATSSPNVQTQCHQPPVVRSQTHQASVSQTTPTQTTPSQYTPASVSTARAPQFHRSSHVTPSQQQRIEQAFGPAPVSQSQPQNGSYIQYNEPSTSVASTTTSFYSPNESEPVFTHAISFKPNEPENGQKAREQLELLDSGKINEINQSKVPTTIELPPNCKLFQYSWVLDGIPRTLLVPMPMDATEEDVKAMLPKTLEMDSNLFNNARPRDELPVLSFPNGTVPNVEMIGPKVQQPMLVNPKQFNRIMRRREMRQQLEASGRLPLARQKYLHESRHLHALKRKRGLDGRFDNTKTAESSSMVSSTTSPRKLKRRNRLPGEETSDSSSIVLPSPVEIQPKGGIVNSSMPSTSTGYINNGMDHQTDYIEHQQPMSTYDQYHDHVQYIAPDGNVNYHNNHDNGVDLTGSDGQSFTNL
ncbi:Nuclear transcription factor Y subunit nfya-1 [Caenorhabditis elegans]|uniref:Nuclear transcription factor Y subunit nfya-1 n=1 Tax=Caenorhabditis elegans TaxID=6239 RepID=NFYA1_CAEEL|nr:Nuclear transcription factor Y subunit nfya-1 [Caenorhabditis elegans]G5EEG1.1 RecName: Full=Nuclear transcription factor Y subunit nfya-1; AltName: Full=CAAT box DNA-binding protein subunit nfya-1 [Caenorhabditis elegans]CAA90639.1 Nuclear transcription factor Y subunit nfya-1 [Caenorhabditis elegans]|eukprot:NP_509999.1 Nuclear transcription Factor Y, A (alpha) subunit [Caenorhabditis elegans]